MDKTEKKYQVMPFLLFINGIEQIFLFYFSILKKNCIIDDIMLKFCCLCKLTRSKL